MPAMLPCRAPKGALAGMRIGIIRESMVYPEDSKTEEPIVTVAAKEIKAMGLASATEYYAASALYTTLASLSRAG